MNINSEYGIIMYTLEHSCDTVEDTMYIACICDYLCISNSDVFTVLYAYKEGGTSPHPQKYVLVFFLISIFVLHL